MTRLFEIPLKLTTNVSMMLAIIFSFLAAVSWTAARSAISTIAPIMAYILAALAILTAAISALTYCAWRFNWMITKIAESKRDRTLARNEAEQANIETDRHHMRLSAEMSMMEATIRQIEDGLIHPAALGDGKFSSFPAQVIKHIEDQSGVMIEAERRQELLPALSDCPNILIVGGKGRGKTNLMQWIEYDRLKRGNISTVLDSHAQPSQWGGQVIGAGRNYESITAAMIDLNTTLDNRYNHFSKGQSDFAIIDTFIDEFTLLPKKLKLIDFDVQDYSFSALTEGRKVGMNCIWGSHSDRAEALGLKGSYDLLECFDAIVYLKKVKSDYYAQVNFGEGTGETKYNHPGVFTVDRPASKVTILSLPAPMDNEPGIAVTNWPARKDQQADAGPTEDEKREIKAFIKIRDSGKFSWRRATKMAYNGKFGDGPNKNLRSTLDKFGIDYSDYMSE